MWTLAGKTAISSPVSHQRARRRVGAGPPSARRRSRRRRSSGPRRGADRHVVGDGRLVLAGAEEVHRPGEHPEEPRAGASGSRADRLRSGRPDRRRPDRGARSARTPGPSRGRPPRARPTRPLPARRSRPRLRRRARPPRTLRGPVELARSAAVSQAQRRPAPGRTGTGSRTRPGRLAAPELVAVAVPARRRLLGLLGLGADPQQGVASSPKTLRSASAQPRRGARRLDRHRLGPLVEHVLARVQHLLGGRGRAGLERVVDELPAPGVVAQRGDEPLPPR